MRQPGRRAHKLLRHLGVVLCSSQQQPVGEPQMTVVQQLRKTQANASLSQSRDPASRSERALPSRPTVHSNLAKP